MVGNHDGAPDLSALQVVGDELPLQLAQVDGRPGLRPHWDGVRGAPSQVLVNVNSSAPMTAGAG